MSKRTEPTGKEQEQRNYHFEIWDAIFEAQVKLELLNSLVELMCDDAEVNRETNCGILLAERTGNLLHIIADGIDYALENIVKANELDSEQREKQKEQKEE